ncbi:gamma-glutamyltransferase [Aurantivibrio plasticivorans]
MLSLIRSTITVVLSLSLATAVASTQYSAVTTDGKGAIATVHPIATQAALDAYKQGGNAIDAAVAAAFALGVVDGHNSGIGGGCFALVHWADGTVQAVDGREMAPGKATREMYVRNGTVDRDLSKTGPLAIGIPGSVATYEYLINQGGKLSFPAIINPIADIAGRGFPVDGIYASRLARAAPALKAFEGSKSVLLPGGKPLQAGDTLIQKDLENTYRHIAKEGAGYFYKGRFASQVGDWMAKHGGIITEEDFANYQLKLRTPVKSEYRGYTVYGFPPPSSGGVHVAQILNILENFDIAELSIEERQHLLAEAMKRAFADRAHWLGDPDFVDVPRGLIDQGYADQLSSQIDARKTTLVKTHGTPPKADTDIFGKHTTHIAAADAEGNWVAITTTVNTGFGSKVIVPGTGVILNNQMDDFSAKPGTPNAYRLVGAEANSIAPGKRPLSSMSPTIILKDGKPVLTTGAAGGPTIITQVLQTVVNHLDLKMDVNASLAAPRIHHQWAPDRLFVESALDSTVKESLKGKGHDLLERGYMGSSQAISYQGGKFEAASEPRLHIRNKP